MLSAAMYTFRHERFRFPGDSYADLVHQAARWGCNAVALMMLQIGELPADQQRAVSRAVAEHGLAVTVHESTHLDPARIALAGELFGDRLRGVSIDRAGSAERPDVPAMARWLLAALDALGDHGTWVAIEDFPLSQAELDAHRDALEPLLATGRLGTLLDAGHLNVRLNRAGRAGGTALARAVCNLPLEIVEVHLHDNDGLADQHRPLGEGTLDVQDLLDALAARGFDGPLTLEVAPAVTGSTPEADGPAIAANLAWLSEHWPKAI